MTRANDTDKTWPGPLDLASTEPDGAVRDATDPQGAPTIDDGESPEHGEVLLAGLRRQRPPPKVVPRTLAASDGDAAAAYYASPRDVARRVKTAPPAPAVEIAETRSPEAPPVAAAARDDGRSLPTVVQRPRRRERLVVGACLALIAVAFLVAFVVAWQGDEIRARGTTTPGPSVAASETPSFPASSSSAAVVAERAPAAPASVAPEPTPPPAAPSSPLSSATPKRPSPVPAASASAPVTPTLSPPPTITPPNVVPPPPRDDSARVL